MSSRNKENENPVVMVRNVRGHGPRGRQADINLFYSVDPNAALDKKSFAELVKLIHNGDKKGLPRLKNGGKLR
jgi:hypothetical protein